MYKQFVLVLFFRYIYKTFGVKKKQKPTERTFRINAIEILAINAKSRNLVKSRKIKIFFSSAPYLI